MVVPVTYQGLFQFITNAINSNKNRSDEDTTIEIGLFQFIYIDIF